jgi:hypothetical protein
VAKVTPKRIPKYLTGSPTSILIASQAMHHSRFARDNYSLVARLKKSEQCEG